MNRKEILKNGIVKSNPLFVLLLGLCPSLAITYSFNNSIAMGISVLFVLIFSNLIISSLRKLIPQQIRIPIYIVIIATLVTSITMLMEAFTYNLYMSLGIFLPLMTVNCIILGRAEAFAGKNKVLDSLFDAFANGIGFLIALITIGLLREFIGTGSIVINNPFNNQIIFSTNMIFDFFGGILNSTNPTFISDFLNNYSINLLVQPIGAFITIGLIIAFINYYKYRKEGVK